MATVVQARGRNGHLLGACHLPDSIQDTLYL